MSLVADNQIPAAFGRRQLGLDVLIARELIQTRDDEVRLKEPVAGAGGLQLVVGQDLERQIEARTSCTGASICRLRS